MSLDPVTVYSSFTSAETAFLEAFAGGSYTEGDVFYVNDSGVPVNLGIGTLGQALTVSASGIPEWSTIAGSGDVIKVGTPVDGQIGVWTGDGTIEGDSALTFDTTTDSLVIAVSGNLLFGAVTVLDDNAGAMTLSNIDALDATTEATIEGAIDTLANLVTVQGLTVTLADAGADAIFGWDDSASAYQNLSASDARTALGLVIGTNVQAYDAGLLSIAGLTTAADRMIYTTASDTYAVTTLTAFGRSLIDDANSSAARTTLGLVIGTNVQAQDAELQAIAGLTSAADRGIYFTGSGTASLFTLTTAGRALIDDASASAQRTTLGVGTADSPQFTAVNIGNASDTTVARVSAGQISVEGVQIVTLTNSVTMTNKTLTSPSIATPTFTSDISMNGNNLTDVQRLLIDATPDSDHSATGNTTDSLNAGATLTAFEVSYLGSGGTWLVADASATATADKMLAINLEAGTASNPIDVALAGSFVRDDTWNWTVGGAIYLSETAGALTQTAPSTTDSVVRVLGYAVTADVIWFNPETGVVHV
jgi:hypothetical protein